jgi:hypothetical protein
MVRSAVENQGGTIEVASSASGGARFQIRLPRDGRAVLDEPAGRDLPAASAGREASRG